MDNKENITAKLNTVPLDAFDYCFAQILLRCEKCVAVRQITLERKIKQSSAYFKCYVFTEQFLEVGCFNS